MFYIQNLWWCVITFFQRNVLETVTISHWHLLDTETFFTNEHFKNDEEKIDFEDLNKTCQACEHIHRDLEHILHQQSERENIW